MVLCVVDLWLSDTGYSLLRFVNGVLNTTFSPQSRIRTDVKLNMLEPTGSNSSSKQHRQNG